MTDMQLSISIPKLKPNEKQRKTSKYESHDIMQMTKHRVNTIHVNVDGTLSVHFKPIYDCSAKFDDIVEINLPAAVIYGHFASIVRTPHTMYIKLRDWTIERKDR